MVSFFLLGACTTLPKGDPDVDAQQKSMGVASWYGENFDGRITANGERYAKDDLTAAHRTLPFGTLLFVTNIENGRTVRVRINDRGPYVQGRILDVSHAAAKELEMLRRGTTRIVFTVAEGKGERDLTAQAVAHDVQPQVVPLTVRFAQANDMTLQPMSEASTRYSRQEGPRLGSLGDVWHNRRVRRHEAGLELQRLV